MFHIEGNDIYLTRGDTLVLDIGMYKDGTIYTPVSGETVRFAMKYRYEDADDNAVINKNININTMQLILAPNETKQLVMGHNYVYDIEFTDINNNVDTFIKGTFYIGEEVL